MKRKRKHSGSAEEGDDRPLERKGELIFDLGPNLI